MFDQRFYHKVIVRKTVRIRVPMTSDHMQENKEHSFNLHGDTIKVPTHWRHGLLLPDGSGIIVNRHFYNIGRGDLGGNITARVEVIEKTTRDGRKFIMFDITKVANDDKPTHEMKLLLASDEKAKGGIKIHHSKMKICFSPIMPKQPAGAVA